MDVLVEVEPLLSPEENRHSVSGIFPHCEHFNAQNLTEISIPSVSGAA